MSVVTIAEAWPAAGRPFTVAELDRMPDDGRRREVHRAAAARDRDPVAQHRAGRRRTCPAVSGRRLVPIQRLSATARPTTTLSRASRAASRSSFAEAVMPGFQRRRHVANEL